MATLTKAQVSAELDAMFEAADRLKASQPTFSTTASYYDVTGPQLVQLKQELQADPNWEFDQKAYEAGRGSTVFAFTQRTPISALVAPTKIAYSLTDGIGKLIVIGEELPGETAADSRGWKTHTVATVNANKRRKRAKGKAVAKRNNAKQSLYATI